MGPAAARSDSSPLSRLASLGAASLSDAELLEILLGPQAQTVLDRVGGLKPLLQRPLNEFARIPGVSHAKARRLQVAVELGRRALLPVDTRPTLRTPSEIARHLQPHLGALSHEEFHVLAFNARNVLVSHERIATGDATSCPVSPREVFRVALRSDTSCIVLAHNHPSGSPEPSSLDISLTAALEEGARHLGIRILDHVVLGDAGGFVSFLQRGLLRSHGGR